MKLKRMIAAFVAAASLCTMLVALPAAAAAPAGFTDISDPTVAQAAETLRLLNIVSGDGGGAFFPNVTLNRAQFCKMTVMALDKGAEAEAQMNRTIFPDVLGSHWARGFVNLAATTTIGGDSEGKGAEMLMMGKGDGAFYPEDVITYAEAVTIMMRVLGYNTRDMAAGSNWYDGPLATAKVIGLTDGLALSWNSEMTRGQTALLFENMLYTNQKGSKESYLMAKLGGSVTKEAVVLSLNATTDDGTGGAILLTGDVPPYKTNHTPFDVALEGYRAKLVLDKDERVIAIQPAMGGSSRTVSIVTAEATYVTAAGGDKVELTPDTIVYRAGKATTYKDIYLNLKSSTQATFHYATTGKLEYVFLPTSDMAERAAIATATGGNPFAALVGSDTAYRVVKNGLAATLADVRQYDVGTYDRGTKTLYVSDLRLTGVYENVSPSPLSPTAVTILGAEFPVLGTAYEALSRFKIGDTITLLFTTDGQVAGALPAATASSTTVGVITKTGDFNEEKSTVEVTVTPLFGLKDAKGTPITLSGTASVARTDAAKLQGQLVTVSSSKVGQISVTRLAASGAKGVLDLTRRTLDGSTLAENVRLFERVGAGAAKEISFSQLTRATVPASKISYVGKDYADRVTILVFDDVTGDQFSYGFAVSGTMSGGSGSLSFSNPTVCVEFGAGKQSDPLITGATIKEGSPIGISASLESAGNVNRLAGWIALRAATQVPRAAFAFEERANESDMTPLGTVTVGSMSVPIAANVACYNKITKKWFATLTDARAYSNSLTVYYDKAPQDGGKVRLVVVES